jgi:hypothetical protein
MQTSPMVLKQFFFSIDFSLFFSFFQKAKNLSSKNQKQKKQRNTFSTLQVSVS